MAHADAGAVRGPYCSGMSTAAAAGGSRSTSRLLVGRDDDLARLEALVDEIVAGHRLGTVLVEGPAGIGKTRVVHDLGARLEARGVDVVVGHCVAQGEQLLPKAPVVELLSELVRREGALFTLTTAGQRKSTSLRLLEDADGTPQGHACLDWTERRDHLAGPLGIGLTQGLLELGWLRRKPDTRALRITVEGARGFRDAFGLSVEAG